MTSFEWFLLIVVVIVVPLIIAVVVTLWTIDQANKRKRANRNDAQIGVKRKAALSPEEVEERKAARARKQQEENQSGIAAAAIIADPSTPRDDSQDVSENDAKDVADPSPTPSDSGFGGDSSDPGSSDTSGGGDSGGSDGGGGDSGGSAE